MAVLDLDLPEQLPAALAIFPLPGVLLLPGSQLPLNIFEPRYLDMVRDAMAGARLIGMVQPRDPRADLKHPDVYPVGCAGLITAFKETDDGRNLITLTGVSRFGIVQDELDTMTKLSPSQSGLAAVPTRPPARDRDPGEPGGLLARGP